MPFNINEFRSRIGNGLAAPSRFRVLLAGAPGVDTEEARILAILCNQAQLPARQFATIDYTTHGPIMKMPYQNMYDDVVMSFYCKETMEVKRFFQRWQNDICDNGQDAQFNYLNEYVSDIFIEQFDAFGNVTYVCKLIDAYPMMVSPLQLDWASQNAFHNLQVTFAYRYWVDEDINIIPFSSTVKKNDLYPNLDEHGGMRETGIAMGSLQGGQFASATQKNIRGFALNVGSKKTVPLTTLQHSMAVNNKSRPNTVDDDFILHD